MSRGIFVCQWPVARADPIRPKNTSARTAATTCGFSARLRPAGRRRLSGLLGIEPFAAASASCSAFSAGQTATHSMQPVHSTERICINLSTGRWEGQALLHLPQSMHACASRRIFTGLKTDDNAHQRAVGTEKAAPEVLDEDRQSDEEHQDHDPESPVRKKLSIFTSATIPNGDERKSPRSFSRTW